MLICSGASEGGKEEERKGKICNWLPYTHNGDLKEKKITASVGALNMM